MTLIHITILKHSMTTCCHDTDTECTRTRSESDREREIERDSIKLVNELVYGS